ncbi:hypothetical protein PTKIN_Ptkin14bG0057900 [Pterospermum kingtungense]
MPEGNTILHMPARFRCISLVKQIVNQCPSLVWKTNLKGETPLHIVAIAEKVEVVECIIESREAYLRKYIASIKDSYGNTPFHCAVRNEHGSVVEALAVEDTTSLLQINDAGESPLSIAINMKSTNIAMKTIQRNNSTTELIGHNGRSALHYTVIRHYSGKVLL